MFQTKIRRFVGWLAIVLLFVACSRQEYECTDCIKVYVPSDPKQLTPLNATDPTAGVVFQYTFQTLLAFDPSQYNLVPVLAKTRPSFQKKTNGKIEAFFEIRPEAVWDDNTPITGHDVAFSLKVIKCPNTDNHHLKPDFKTFENVFVDKNNPKKFSILYSEPSMLVEIALTELLIIPSSVYDPKNILTNYSFEELNQNTDALINDPTLLNFTNFYNSPKFQKKIIKASGPYSLKNWQTNRRIVLKLKENWWGKALATENAWFKAFPKELVLEIYTNPNDAIRALRRKKIDAMNEIPPKEFAQNWFAADSKYQYEFNLFTAPSFSYDYIGLNLRSKKLEDLRVRQALAHLTNVHQLIETTSFGFAERIISFTHPALVQYQNLNIQPFDFDLQKADSLLSDAGWVDLDSNGVRSKRFDDSTEIELSLTIFYNQGNDRRLEACKILQNACKKVGVNIQIQSLELLEMLDSLKKHNFDLYVGGWVSSPKEADPTEIWHSQSINGGSNYVGFGNEKSDAIVKKISSEINETKRAKLYQELHAIIHQEIPYIFLLSQKQLMAVNKDFENVTSTGFSPGFYLPSFVKINLLLQ